MDRSQRGLFCGEALGLPPHLLPSVAPYSFDEEDYLATIESLRQMDPRVLFFAHGGAVVHPRAAFAGAAENTRIYSRLMLDGLRKGESTAQIALRFVADVQRRFGLTGSPDGAQIFVTGYLMYYRKKGLV